MEHARPPAELCLDGGPAARSDAWRAWRKQFEVFLKASGVSKEPKEVQASLLVNLIGSAGYDIFTTFTFEDSTGESEDDVTCVLKKFDAYFGAKPNITVRRYKFFTRAQEEGENIDRYVTALRVLSKQCEFGELHDSLLRDKIVCGIKNNTVRDRLLRTDDLTLTKAIQICQAAAAAATAAAAGPSHIVNAGKSRTLWRSGVRRRRPRVVAEEQRASDYQAQVKTDTESANSSSSSSSANSELLQPRPEVSGDVEGDSYDNFSDACTSSSPLVSISRSKERTARMLSNLLFRSNE